MIKVFAGRWRGLGEKSEGLGMIIDFDFRSILHYFRGAKLSVFMCVALHSDQNGLSYPSYDLIEKETGYTRDSIATALEDLCKLEIEGQRVLARYRERDTSGQFTGSNRYLIFPTREEIQSLLFPTLENSTCGKTGPEVKPVLKDKPGIKKTFGAGETTPPAREGERERRTDAKRKGDLVDGALNFSGRGRLRGIEDYAADVQAVIEEFCKLWNLTPATGTYKSLWTKEARELLSALGEFGPAALQAVYEHWRAKKFDVGRPGAIIKTARFIAGQLRENQPSLFPEPDPGPLDESHQEQLEDMRRNFTPFINLGE